MPATTRRQFLRRSGALAAAGIVSPSAIQRALAAASDASFVLRNGAVLTFDGRKDPATCVAIRDDLIVYVGSDAGAADLIGPATEVIDLRGRTVMPGIQDGHMHPLSAGQSLQQCSLNYLPLTLDQMRARITVCLDQTRRRSPTAGFGSGSGTTRRSSRPGPSPRRPTSTCWTRHVLSWSTRSTDTQRSRTPERSSSRA